MMEELVRRFLNHGISRRDFVRQLGVLGVATTTADSLLAQIGTEGPMGAGKGIHPGRVVWVRDPAATSWDGETGNWWDDANSDQAVVDGMISRTLQSLTGESTDRQAWDALFRHFNRTHGLGDTGYRSGEKIAVKINCNQDRSPVWGGPRLGGAPLPDGEGGPNGLPSPHMSSALVAQLINEAGVPGEDLTIYEVCKGRNIGQPVYTKIRANAKPDFQAVTFLVGTDHGLGGRITPTVDRTNPVRFSKEGVPTAYLPEQVTAAKYLINLALLRSHRIAGVTLCAKNHFGSIHFPDDSGWSPSPLHGYIARTNPMGSYSPLVDLSGHRHLGEKTVLFVLDGLYTAYHNEGTVFRFSTFGDDWASSLLMSQDPVAIDSVGLDILKTEPTADVQGSADNYLHEAAQAGEPPSGTVYDPNGTGEPLASLGVHEHWNNAKDKKYSRNLGRNEGIELIAEVG